MEDKELDKNLNDDLTENTEQEPEKDLFSYANSNDVVDDGEASFDLNAFSSKSMEEEAQKPKKRMSRKQKIVTIILSSILVCIIGGCMALASAWFSLKNLV